MSDPLLERMAISLEELLRWSRLNGMTKLRDTLEQNIPKDMRRAYELSDGRSLREIAKMTGTGKTKIFNYWKKWYLLGLLEKSKKFEGRMNKCFSLQDYGIEVPADDVNRQVQEESQDSQDSQTGEKLE